MGIKCGIVGLPNVGKSTLFNALTKAGVAASNYPFCTIDPNVGVVAVPDERLAQLAALVKPQKVVPTLMEFVDIAGLVEGASKGEGLGNKFLAHIRETDAIGHVVRCFDDPDIVHVAGKVDPKHDVGIINTELLLADLETVDKALEKLGKKARSGDKEGIAQKALLERIKAHLDSGKPARTLAMNKEEIPLLRSLFLLTSKPIVYIANIAENGLENNPYFEQIKNLAQEEGAKVIPICAAIEAELADLEEEDKKIFLTELGLTEPGLNRVIRASYELLGLQTFFTAGVQEVRAWTFHTGNTAPQTAGVIHSDFEKGFIRAEVIAYNDFIKYGGENGAKQAGKWRLEGKDYIVQDGDVMHFRFNV